MHLKACPSGSQAENATGRGGRRRNDPHKRSSTVHFSVSPRPCWDEIKRLASPFSDGDVGRSRSISFEACRKNHDQRNPLLLGRTPAGLLEDERHLERGPFGSPRCRCRETESLSLRCRRDVHHAADSLEDGDDPAQEKSDARSVPPRLWRVPSNARDGKLTWMQAC